MFPLWLAACIALPATVAAQTEPGAEEATTETAPEEVAPEPEPMPAPEPAPVEETAAIAPVTEAAEVEEEEAEEIVVTGTRIKRKSLATAAPVSVLTKDDLLNSGMSSIGEILQNLPANANALNVQFNNGGTGATRVDLRGIQAVRTLVLLNGRRHVPGGTGVNAAVDLNAIPVSIIERVEILKDGASAIYGSDAIGGVVNIITRKDFEGVEASAYSGISQRGDGAIYDVSATAGLTSEKGNIVFSASFYDQQPVFSGERSWSESDVTFDFERYQKDGNPKDEAPYISQNGSIGTPQGTIWDQTGRRGNAAWDAIAYGTCPSGFCFNDPDDGWRDFVFGGNSDTGTGDQYNYQPQNYLVTPSRRWGFYTTGNYELSDYVNVFFEGGFTNRRSVQLLAATPLFTDDVGTISADNAYNPFGRGFDFIGRRTLEEGNRVFSQYINTFRLVLGLEGALPDLGPLQDWTWDAYMNFGRTEGGQTKDGRYSISRLTNALGPEAGCTGDCVQLDVFSGVDGISQDMLDYITFEGNERGWSDQRVAALNIGGPVFELVEDNPIALAAGYQFRREAGGQVPNAIEAAGDMTGGASTPVRGSYKVHAGFAELSLPILGDLPAVELFELSGALRVVDYSTFGTDVTFKLGARWQIADFLAARGTFSTAFRAPSVNELFSGQTDSFPAVSDPCSQTVQGKYLTNPAVKRNCDADGLSNVADPNVQLRSKIGGNPDLDPETARIITGGLVLEDKLVPGLSAAVDYWNIDIKDAIQPIGAGVILTQCYVAENAADRQFCDQVIRGSNGIIEDIIDTQTNVGGVKTSGVDFDVRYAHSTPVGRFGAVVEGTILIDYIQVLPNGYEWSYKGNYDGGSATSGSVNPGVNPDFKLNWSVLWAWEMLNAGINFRYIPGYIECDTDDLCNAEGAEDPAYRDVEAYLDMDIFAGVTFDTFLGSTNVDLGINNLADTDPARVYSAFTAGTDTATYDFMGRYFYGRVTHHF
jgi:outer membrane receptor protein involved in Fe transport